MTTCQDNIYPISTGRETCLCIFPTRGHTTVPLLTSAIHKKPENRISINSTHFFSISYCSTTSTKSRQSVCTRGTTSNQY